MPKPYQNPDEAQQGLTSAFSPSTSEQTTAIQNAASLVPGAPATPTPTTESPYYSRYTPGNDVVDTPVVKAKTENQIVSEKTAAAQGQIDAINKHYQNLLGEQKIINEGRDRSTSSVNTLSGLAGSTEANIQQGKTTELNQKDNQKIQEQQNLQIQNLFGQIRASAVQEAQQSRLEARQSSQDALAARTARQTEAVGQLTNLAQVGTTVAGLKATDPKSYDYFVKSLGGEEQVKAMFTLNRPAETILDKKIEGGKYIIAFQNPLDGKIRMESVDLGLPPNYTKTIDAGDRILAMPEDWDGDPSKLLTINKGLTPSQAQSGSGSGGGGIYDQLDYRSANAVLAQANTFGSSPIVKTYNDLVAAANLINGVDKNTQNPADHQALVYNFAKALDPDSVVREGEYATIKKYSQGLISRFGGEVKQAVSGSGFLSPGAIEAIQTATQNRVKAYQPQYDNLKSQTAQRINNVAGKNVADQVLLDYESGYTAPGGKVLVNSAGEQFDASALSPEEYQQAIADGYTAQ